MLHIFSPPKHRQRGRTSKELNSTLDFLLEVCIELQARVTELQGEPFNPELEKAKLIEKLERIAEGGK